MCIRLVDDPAGGLGDRADHSRHGRSGIAGF
jgi:hypothetical protein